MPRCHREQARNKAVPGDPATAHRAVSTAHDPHLRRGGFRGTPDDASSESTCGSHGNTPTQMNRGPADRLPSSRLNTRSPTYTDVEQHWHRGSNYAAPDPVQSPPTLQKSRPRGPSVGPSGSPSGWGALEPVSSVPPWHGCRSRIGGCRRFSWCPSAQIESRGRVKSSPPGSFSRVPPAIGTPGLWHEIAGGRG
jgi:hypothetical protein